MKGKTQTSEFTLQVRDVPEGQYISREAIRKAFFDSDPLIIKITFCKTFTFITRDVGNGLVSLSLSNAVVPEKGLFRVEKGCRIMPEDLESSTWETEGKNRENK